jgi:hypothetical protein
MPFEERGWAYPTRDFIAHPCNRALSTSSFATSLEPIAEKRANTAMSIAVIQKPLRKYFIPKGLTPEDTWPGISLKSIK